MSGPTPFTIVPPVGEVITFKQKSRESFKKAWGRMLELHKNVQPKMDLGVLINFFYYSLFSLYQNALDTMVGETFSEYDAAKSY